MFDLNATTEFKNKLFSAKSVLLLLPPEPDLDATSAALCLYQALRGDKTGLPAGRQVLLGCSSDVAAKYPDLEGAEQTKSHIGNQTLVVSFDYQEDAVENVSYDIDDATKKFNLRIQPRPNQPPLDVDKVSYSYTGAQADLVVTFGINSLEELGRIYSEEKVFLDAATITNIISSPRASSFAAINLNTPSPLTEAIALLIKDLDLKLDPTSSSTLLQQLSKNTNNFQAPNVSADTFELAAFLLRNGATRHSQGEVGPRPFPTSFPFVPPTQPDAPNELMNKSTSQQSSGVPTDWSGPKIYRGGTPLR